MRIAIDAGGNGRMAKPIRVVPKPKSPGEETFAFHCKMHGLVPEREVQFYLPRKWRFDFGWSHLKIAVEIEGGTWVNGRHNRGSSIEADFRKYNQAAALGWRVFRYSTEMVESGEAILQIFELIGQASAAPQSLSEWP